MPMAAGYLRPTVALPAEADLWPAERITSVLLHELAHVRRRDCLTQLAASTTCALYWMNPLAWYAARALARHRDELARGRRFGFLHKLPGMTGSQAALAYVLASRDVSAAVFGATRLAHLHENLAAADLALPTDVMAAIRAVQGPGTK